MKKRSIAIIMTFILLAGILSGCAGETQQTETSAPETNAEPVTLTVAGSWEDCRALDEVARAFTAQYPNCTIVYEYVQEYSESVVKRMEGDKPFDLFFCGGIQSAGWPVKPCK